MTIVLLVFLISQTGSKTLVFDDVIEQARQLSKQDFERQKETASELLKNADYAATRKIRMRDEAYVWREQGLPFQLGFFPTAGLHSRPVSIFSVSNDGARWLKPESSSFDYLDNVVPPEERHLVDYAGVRVMYPINERGRLDEVIALLGASYFRAVAKGQSWGISARGIALDPGGEDAEEFPDFTKFWFIEPTAASTDLRFYALLDGPSLTGAYEFRVYPGPETKVAVKAVLFARKDISILGIAAMTSMFWYGENTSNTFGNFRPEIHDSDGLQIKTAKGEWLWRPLAWSQQTQWNVFEAPETPSGFGLFQRDRDFEHYQDLETHYHQRPSLWIEPGGDWGPGRVKLLQLPTDNEYMDNVVAFWEPKETFEAGESLEFDYTLVWFGENAGLPPLGRNIATRIDYQNEKYYRNVVLDFGGGELSGLPADAPVKPIIWVSDNGAVKNPGVQKNSNDSTWRVNFVPTTDQSDLPIEMRCTLMLDGRPVSETWTYTWIP